MSKICTYVKSCFGGDCILQSVDPSDVIACLALLVAILAYRESKKLRQEQGGAFLYIDLMQVNSDIYAVIHNIGNSYAYDVQVTVTKPFANRFSNLKLIPPATSYRYSLLRSQDASEYPCEIVFSVSYCDRHTKQTRKAEEFRFVLIDYLKYDVVYHTEPEGYEINKTY